MTSLTREELDAACREFGTTLDDNLREQRKLKYAKTKKRSIMYVRETTYGVTPRNNSAIKFRNTSMDDKVKAIIEQGKIEQIESVLAGTYSVKNLNIVDGTVKECPRLNASFFGIYFTSATAKEVSVGAMNTRDDADFVCKCLQARYK